jgi:MFS family permease
MLFGFYGRATRNFLILLVSMHYILFIDRVNLATAAPVMQQDLGLSNLALGLAFSAFNYSYAPFQLVGGWFADRFGARRTLTVCGLAWSLTTMATGAVTGLASLLPSATSMYPATSPNSSTASTADTISPP